MGAYDTTLEAGIAHVQKHLAVLSADVDEFAHSADSGTGNPYWATLRLGSHAAASAMLAWFVDRDLVGLKRWSYAAGRLQGIAMKMSPGEWLYYAAHRLFYPLLSDNEELIAAQFDFPFNQEKIDNPRTHDFLGYQALLAVRGDWEQVSTRSRRFLTDPAPKMKKYQTDYRFFEALARGEPLKMVEALRELTSPKLARFRNNEFGLVFSDRFVASHAVIYAKIAWRHGYRIEIDTPYIPHDWLPVSPIASYSDPYAFMSRFPLTKTQ